MNHMVQYADIPTLLAGPLGPPMRISALHKKCIYNFKKRRHGKQKNKLYQNKGIQIECSHKMLQYTLILDGDRRDWVLNSKIQLKIINHPIFNAWPKLQLQEKVDWVQSISKTKCVFIKPGESKGEKQIITCKTP